MESLKAHADENAEYSSLSCRRMTMKSTLFPRSALMVLISVLSCNVQAVSDDGGRPLPPPRDPPTRADLVKLIDEAMPDDIGNTNTELLERLLKPRIAPTGPSEAFNVQRMTAALRLRRVVPGKGCFLPPPRTECELTEGSRTGGGAFKKVEADSLGNVSYLSRLPDPSAGNPEGGAAPPLPSFSLADKAAQDRFANVFTQIFGVPVEELPAPSSWVIERLQVGMQDADKPTAGAEIKEIAGVVTIPRVLLVDGLKQPLVPVLGSHVQGAMDDLGGGLPFRVEVQGWTRFTFPAALQKARAMTRAQLVDGIASELERSLREKPRSIAIEIAYAKVGDFDTDLGSYGGPDSNEGPAAASSGDGLPDDQRFVPVVLTSISPMSADSSEEEQAAAFSTAGVEFVTPLFAVTE